MASLYCVIVMLNGALEEVSPQVWAKKRLRRFFLRRHYLRSSELFRTSLKFCKNFYGKFYGFSYKNRRIVTQWRYCKQVRTEGDKPTFNPYFYIPKYRSSDALPAPEIFVLFLVTETETNQSRKWIVLETETIHFVSVFVYLVSISGLFLFPFPGNGFLPLFSY